MKSRRNFIIQGSLATTAMFALNPFKSIARTASTFSGFSGRNRKLVFLHTTGLNTGNDHKTIQYINEIKSNNANTILLKAGHDHRDQTDSISYDASIHGSKELSAITGDYKIITKGNIKTGIICANPGENDIIQKINSLSTYLKKEKNCAFVVCLSKLGHTNKDTPDDIKLAEKSTHLDIIIGGHSENFKAHPYIALNNNNQEVIIHSALGDLDAYGKIEIDMDEMGRKKLVRFTK
jgi:2',3'-cyclic-nucleotide 2'-phosphodiesterase (5'-nucleotidase family)